MQKETKEDVTINKLVYKGLGLGKLKSGKHVFIPNTLPEDVVTCKVTKKKKGYCFGEKIDLIKSSSYRESSGCTHFPLCGGCQFMDVSYENQLKLKRDIFLDCLTSSSLKIDHLVTNIIPSPSTQYYRNKMEYSFGETSEGVFLGLKKRGQFDQVIPTPTCKLLSQETPDILHFTQNFFTQKKTSVWNHHTHQGLLRYLVIRHSKTKNTYLLNIVSSEENTPLFTEFSEKIQKRFPNITSICLTINPHKADTSFSLDYKILSGSGFLEETLGRMTYKISHLSFFQPNTEASEKLYETILKLASPKKTDTLLDLYCGAGTIGLFLAPYVQEVIGIEENPSAIEDAKENARLNGIKKTTYYCGRVKNILKFNSFSPDCIIVDPPRSGMVPKAVKRLCEIQAPTLIYVSCNPNTLIRDLDIITENNYSICDLKIIDQFPNTYHLETVVLLKKKT
ncbi:23S rRNA (uracil(1939)-C(5))-methyltransferase RlmD [Candidatus Marinamargulisbacteria bacterium SCGC AG-439-L15]|nr:23S rRNA (uracil(1939)-C(5))-methyltransferase RlmD [Candidatus Marinamargulisbacteria bacterium SCGC AG-439-L15]